MAHSAARINQLDDADRAFHDWYRFVLSFPPHLVREYLDRFGIEAGQRVLDPFCGTGTTLVEAKRRGTHSVGIEPNPVAHLASSVKTDWSVGADELLAEGDRIAAEVQGELADAQTPDFAAATRPRRVALRGLPPEVEALLLTGSISPLPLHKALHLRDAIRRRRGALSGHLLLALARTLVEASNLRFGPEVGVGPPKEDAPVVASWRHMVRAMAGDLSAWSRSGGDAETRVVHGDARCALDHLAPNSIDAVITSPPYPNEKDYTRTTRLELVLLGYVNSREELRALKHTFLRSNTRGVYRQDDDDAWIKDQPSVESVAAEIERRRLALGKTSGFERMYGRVTRLYFGGIARHLAGLRPALRPGAHLAYVVGDQASYLRVLIRTGQIIAEIAENLGYEVVGIDLFRTRLATATRQQLREEVVVLRWTKR